MVVPPNHPILIGFSIINHPCWSTPIFGNTQIVMFAKSLLNEHRKRINPAFLEAFGSWRRRFSTLPTTHLPILLPQYRFMWEGITKRFQWNDDSCVRLYPFQPIHESIFAFWCRYKKSLQQLAEPKGKRNEVFPLVSEALEKKPSFLPLKNHGHWRFGISKNLSISSQSHH